ncbi:patatin-like phospholipase family protein [Microbulbifer sp. YPW16]|uniref:patatin-like phospholipase family protein n=1 Tax=unclassified Microbulbifer TaxID=2619833 RepID=UPI001E49D7BC|nr:patatin-like phospholipase family protein [Microbulbifer sp. YPW16]UHQ56063.1 patatin-like phospholipase family protein [Microbulbifer sp. YPW16]
MRRDVSVAVVRILVAGLLLACTACSYMPEQAVPLARWSPERNAAAREKMTGDRSTEIAVLLAFSGGGTRAAALSYGVLRELDRTPVRTSAGERTMLQEVDMISSVSGGSFTAAYYGLYGERIFADYEERFLRRDVQGELVRRALSPSNWQRLASPTFGRIDLAAEYYDELLFDDAPLGALVRPGVPRVVINSTDLATGERVPFVQEMFDLFCLDLESYPLSRAVAASSAVPLVFSPVAVQSHAGSCGFRQPAWVDLALEDDQLTSRKIAARSVKAYLDRERRPWLHLVDGGISDNLGLRSYYRTITLTADPAIDSSLLPHLNARHILVILVNANSHPHREWAQEPHSPPFLEVAGSVSGSQIQRFSDDTILITRKMFEQWVDESSTPDRPLTFHFVEVSFDRVRNDADRQYLNNIGTTFRLTDTEVDRLIAAGQQVLADSPAYRDFVRLVQGAR